MGKKYTVKCSITDECDWTTRDFREDAVQEEYKRHILKEHYDKLRRIPNLNRFGAKKLSCRCGYTTRKEFPKEECPECGSERSTKVGTVIESHDVKQYLYACLDCPEVFRGDKIKRRNPHA